MTRSADFPETGVPVALKGGGWAARTCALALGTSGSKAKRKKPAEGLMMDLAVAGLGQHLPVAERVISSPNRT